MKRTWEHKRENKIEMEINNGRLCRVSWHRDDAIRFTARTEYWRAHCPSQFLRIHIFFQCAHCKESLSLYNFKCQCQDIIFGTVIKGNFCCKGKKTTHKQCHQLNFNFNCSLNVCSIYLLFMFGLQMTRFTSLTLQATWQLPYYFVCLVYSHFYRANITDTDESSHFTYIQWCASQIDLIQTIIFFINFHR